MSARNHAAEAKARGNRLIAIEIDAEIDSAIREAQDHLAKSQLSGRCTLGQAIAWLVSHGRKKIPKKSADSG